MNVRNCRKCGRLFNYVSGQAFCPRCKEDLEQKFQEVKSYLWDHKSAGIQEVADECDVEPHQIKQWIREERLELASDSAIMIPCERCGALIKCGRFCEKCKKEMADDFKQTTNSLKREPERPKKASTDPVKNKMRYLDR